MPILTYSHEMYGKEQKSCLSTFPSYPFQERYLFIYLFVLFHTAIYFIYMCIIIIIIIIIIIYYYYLGKLHFQFSSLILCYLYTKENKNDVFFI